MARLTGQFTTPSFDAQNNKTHTPFLHAVVFVFTSGTTKVTRETDAAGKYSFDLANGEYDVSVYLKGSSEKDRFDMRAGEKFAVTAATKADDLEKWLQVIGNNGKDELAAYYESLLAQMDAVFKQFQDETKSDGTGLFVKQSAAKRNFLNTSGGYTSQSNTVPALVAGDSGLAMGGVSFLTNNPGLDLSKVGLNNNFIYYEIQRNFSERLVANFYGYNAPIFVQSVTNANGVWSEPARFYATNNTTVDSNGFIKAASPIIKLFNDRIETNDQFDGEPLFEKIATGTYKISNTLGLAKEGWTYEKPRGSDGNPYFRVKVEKLDDGCIVSVHDEYVDYEDIEITDIDGNKRIVKERVTVLSAARDIKDHERWIDLRFHEEPQEDAEMLAEMTEDHKEE